MQSTATQVRSQQAFQPHIPVLAWQSCSYSIHYALLTIRHPVNSPVVTLVQSLEPVPRWQTHSQPLPFHAHASQLIPRKGRRATTQAFPYFVGSRLSILFILRMIYTSNLIGSRPSRPGSPCQNDLNCRSPGSSARSSTSTSSFHPILPRHTRPHKHAPGR
jgi:hypothetical protein